MTFRRLCCISLVGCKCTNQHPCPLPHPTVLLAPYNHLQGKAQGFLGSAFWQSDTSQGHAETGLPVAFFSLTTDYPSLIWPSVHLSVRSQSLSLPNLNCLFSSRKNRNAIPRLSCLFLSPFLSTALQLLKRGLFLHASFESQTTGFKMVC